MKKSLQIYISESSSGLLDSPEEPTLHLRLINLWLVLVLLCVMTGCGKHRDQQTQKMAVQTETAKSMDNLRSGDTAAYIAMVRADNETDLGFKVGGIVDIIGPARGSDWDEGSAVKAGTVLASLKQSDFVNALNSAKAQAELTTKQFERFRKLRESDAISQEELDVSEANYHTAQAQLDQANQNLQDSQVRASIDGVVLARYVNSGVTVAAGQRVLRFAENTIMRVELGLPDRLVAFFSPGKEVDVEISAFEGRPPFRGRVSEVGVAASQDGRLFRIVIKVPNPDGVIRSGMTATVRVGDLARLRPGAVLVPLSALVTFAPLSQSRAAESSQLAVFVVDAGKALRRAVKTGDINRSSIIITDGLKSGEVVVTSGASFLYNEQPVEVLQNAPIAD
jgi:RND family efflux transporter MFP subunit